MRLPANFLPTDLAWGHYLDGWWRRGQPDQPGLYAVATADGTLAGYRRWHQRGEALAMEGTGPREPGWAGWIWSYPVPAPPQDVPEAETGDFTAAERAEIVLQWIGALEDRQEELRAYRKTLLE